MPKLQHLATLSPQKAFMEIQKLGEASRLRLRYLKQHQHSVYFCDNRVRYIHYGEFKVRKKGLALALGAKKRCLVLSLRTCDHPWGHMVEEGSN